MIREKHFINNYYMFGIAAIILTVGFMFIFGCTTSPLYVANGQDSAVFQIIGRGILEGRIPYKDLEENKGPVLYFIQALSQVFIRSKTGVFIFQIVNHLLVILLIFAFLNEMLKPLIRDKNKLLLQVLVPLLYYCYLYTCYEAGNLSEEYINTFIAFLLITVLLLKRGSKYRRKLMLYFLSGVCYGMIFWIRASDLIGIIPILIVYIAIEIQADLPFRRALSILASWGGGFLFVSGAILAWYAYRGALNELLWGYWYINSSVIQGTEYRVDSFYEFTCLGLIVLSLVAAYLNKNNKEIMILLPLWSLMFTVSVHISKSLFHHYLITGTLLFVVESVAILTVSFEKKQVTALVRVILLSLIIVDCIKIWPLAQPRISKIVYRTDIEQNAPLKVTDYVNAEGKSFYSIGVRADWYQHNNIYPAYRVFHLTQYIGYDSNLRTEFEAFMEDTPPDYLYLASNGFESSLTEKTVDIIHRQYREIMTDLKGNHLLELVEDRQ